MTHSETIQALLSALKGTLGDRLTFVPDAEEESVILVTNDEGCDVAIIDTEVLALYVDLYVDFEGVARDAFGAPQEEAAKKVVERQYRLTWETAGFFVDDHGEVEEWQDDDGAIGCSFAVVAVREMRTVEELVQSLEWVVDQQLMHDAS